MKRRTLAIALAMVLTLLAVPVSAVAANGVVSGTVYGSEGPLGSAQVAVDVIGRGGLPTPVATLTTGPDGSWTYSGKKGDYRFTFTAEGYYSQVKVLKLENNGVYVLDVTLVAVPPPTGTISGRITGSTGAGLHGFVYFYKQNADGTWPTTYMSTLETGWDGSYTKDGLALGVYKVRLFSVHTGVQWYRYVATMDLATSIVLDTPGQIVTGIDAAYPPPVL